MCLKFFRAGGAVVLAFLLAGCGGDDPRAEAREVLDGWLGFYKKNNK